MSINYNPTHLNDNDTILEQLLKIRKYLQTNPIYKIYIYLGDYSTLTTVYDLNLVDIKQGEVLQEKDVILFTNNYFAVVNSVDTEQQQFTILTAFNFGTEGVGTKIYVNGVFTDRQDLTDDIQSQIDYLEGVDNELKESIGRNVDGIARLGTDKQDKLSQTDLDNIAGLNDLQDKLDAKASKTEVNSLSMCPSDTKDDLMSQFTTLMPNVFQSYTAPANGYISGTFRAKVEDNRRGVVIQNESNNLNISCGREGVAIMRGFLPLSKGQTCIIGAKTETEILLLDFIHAKEL